jgi:uncharacterized protein YndB with AHSA1/START domain
MPYTYTLSTVIPASPAEVYDAWLDSIAHAEMTGGGEAVMSDEVGAEISALDGHITGRNLELVAPERIVQAWRTDEFDDETEDSIVTILLQVTEDGTLLTLEHSNVPDQYKSYEEGGWQSNYFEPMIAYFSEFEEDLVEPEQQPQPASLLEPQPKPKDEPEEEDQEEDDDDDEDDEEEEEDDDDEDDEDDEGDEHRDHAEHDARPRAQRELPSRAEHKHESGSEPEVKAPPRAPARAATEAPGAGARSGRERRTGGSSVRKAAPRAAANRRNATPPVALVTGTAERPETNKKVAKLATNKKTAKPAAKKAAKPAARKAAKPASGKKSAAKKKIAKLSARKKAAKKSAQGSAKRRSTKTAARGSAARSGKAGRRKR